MIVHGEFERNDMVEYFGSKIDGFVFTQNAWVQSYGTRCVKPPVVWGDVSRSAPITVEWSVYAQSCTKKPVKGMLTGPVTILNWSFPREDVSLKVQAQEIGFAAGLEAAIGVHPHILLRNFRNDLVESVHNFLFRGNARRVNVIHTRAHLSFKLGFVQGVK